jgi:hypothetical protein
LDFLVWGTAYDRHLSHFFWPYLAKAMKTLDIILCLYVVALSFSVINHVEISNRFTAFENLDTEVDINSAWGTNISILTKENLGYYELKKCCHGWKKDMHETSRSFQE